VVDDKSNSDAVRVLLVDDEADFRSTASKRLSRRGMICLQAKSGEDALAVLEVEPIDVVVLDVKMPGMDGVETLDRIKAQFPDTETILLTGHACAADGVEGIKRGAFDYLTKPIEFEHLLEKIRQAYDRLRWAEERRKEQAFRTKMEQQMIATERLAALGTLSTGVAHEINNPLAMMREAAGYMQLVLEKQDAAAMPRKADLVRGLEKIEKGIERIKRITHLLLGFVKGQNHSFSETDLRHLVDESIELVQREARDKAIDFELQIDDAAAVIWSDPFEIRQVLVNLLTNAVHAIPGDGTITIGVKDCGDHVELVVSDTGQGIPRENLSKIFEPFFSTKSPDQGTGLGLYVTRGIVTKLGGQIDVESRVGRGTAFTVQLPRCYTGDLPGNADPNICLDILQKVKEITDND